MKCTTLCSRMHEKASTRNMENTTGSFSWTYFSLNDSLLIKYVHTYYTPGCKIRLKPKTFIVLQLIPAGRTSDHCFR